MISDNSSNLTYAVPGMSCDHCVAAITDEVSRVEGVASVDVNLAAKRVDVAGADLDDAAIRDAIADAGYEALP